MELTSIEGKIDLSLSIDGRTFQVVACDVSEGLSTLTEIHAEIASKTDIDFGPLVEADAVVVVTIDGAETRRFTGRLARARFVGVKDILHYVVELRPALWFLSLDLDTRKFRDQTTEAIVSSVLNRAGVAHEWRVERPSNSRPYTVQYRETNLAFVTRLLEYEGYYFSFEPDGTMIIGDSSPAEARVPGPFVFELRETAGALAHGALGITSFTSGSNVTTGRASVNDYDWKKPKVVLLQSSAGERDQDLEHYDYPTGYRDPAAGLVLARLRQEAHSCERDWVSGTSTAPWMTSGRQFDFVHFEAMDFSGTYCLVRLQHKFRSAGAADSNGAYENTFFAIPAATPWRPLLTTPRPTIQGNHTAMVRGPAGEEIHTDRFGRAKVQFHWDREAKGTDEDSRWVRVLQETSASMVLARVGWEVGVGYIDGDPDRPIELSRLINGQMMPTYGQPSRKNMMSIKTESYPGKQGFNELRMDDSQGSMRMDWHAERDLATVVENDKTEKVASNYTHLVKNGLDRVVEKNQSVTIGGNETKDVQLDYNDNTKKDRNETVGGSETVQFALSGQRNVEGNDTETVGGSRQTSVGIPGVSVPGAKGMIGMLVPHSLGAPPDGIGGAEVFAASAVQLAGPQAPGREVGQPSGAELKSKLASQVPSAEAVASGAAGGSGGQGGENKGIISRDVRKRLTRTVSGAWLALAGGSVIYSTGTKLGELVGGLKMTLSTEGSIMQTAEKFLRDTVLGMKMRKSKDDMSVSAKETRVKVVGATSLHSDELVECRGKEIVIEGQEKVTLRSGGLLIELTPEKTTITGSLKAKSGNTIKIAGSPDELTA
jgi:type VI secretion system secreted protein VgrG